MFRGLVATLVAVAVLAGGVIAVRAALDTDQARAQSPDAVDR